MKTRNIYKIDETLSGKRIVVVDIYKLGGYEGNVTYKVRSGKLTSDLSTPAGAKAAARNWLAHA